MYMEKIMILGAGIYQVPLIKKAKEMNFYVIVVTIPGDYPGIEYADSVYYVDTRNYEEIVKIAKSEKINGIVTTGTDVAMISIGKVCDELNLCGISYETAISCTDKSEMKERFKGIVRCAESKKIYFDSGIKDLHIKYPCMFKAVDSSGSRGILKLYNSQEVDEAILKIKKVTQKPYFLYEEFIEGHEIGCEAIIINDEVKLILPHDKKVFHADTDVPLGHIFPYICDDELYEDICTQMKKAINALSLKNCVVNADIIIKDNKVYILEVGARAGATGIPELVSLILSQNYYELMINIALGKPVKYDFKIANKVVASELLTSPKTGVIEEFYYDNSLNFTGFDISLDCSVGDTVNKFMIGPDRIGQIIVEGLSIDDMTNKIEEIKKHVVLKIK